ncbi:MAG: hypothetical protein QW041_00595 [Candidatus Pacearchaeota archaeon]
MEFIALLSSGEGTWGQIAGLIKRGEWEKIILLGDNYAKKFISEKQADFISVDLSLPLKELKEEFLKKLRGKISGMEVALSIASGTGKEHMALISALIDMPVGIKFTALTKDGIIFF